MKKLIFTTVFFLVSVFSFGQNVNIIEADTTQFSITDTLQYSGYARYGSVFWEGGKKWFTHNLKAIKKLSNTVIDTIKYNSDKTKALINSNIYEVWNFDIEIQFHRETFEGEYEVYIYNKKLGTKMFYTTAPKCPHCGNILRY